jgi:hypothetical protein
LSRGDPAFENDFSIDNHAWHGADAIPFGFFALLIDSTTPFDDLAAARFHRVLHETQGFIAKRTTRRENFDPPCRRRHDVFFSFFGTQQHLSKVLPVSLQYDLPSFISQQQVLTSFFAAVQNMGWLVSAPKAATANRHANMSVRNDFIQIL